MFNMPHNALFLDIIRRVVKYGNSHEYINTCVNAVRTKLNTFFGTELK